MARMTLKNAKKTASKRKPADKAALNDLYGPTMEPAQKLLIKALKRSIEHEDGQTYAEIVGTDDGREAFKFLNEAERKAGYALGLTVRSQQDTSSISEDRESAGISHLGRSYLESAISSLTRPPSPKLNGDFRATLMHWRACLIAALKDHDEPQALCIAMLAVVQGEGSWQALQLIRNVGNQVTWKAAIDITRDRRTQSEAEEGRSNFLDGQTTHMDSDAVVPPTEDEALDALTEANAWLGTLADQLPVDEDDRVRLGLEHGLEFGQVKEGDSWRRVYDANEMVDIQIAKNRESMKRKNADVVVARKDTILALAALAQPVRKAA